MISINSTTGNIETPSFRKLQREKNIAENRRDTFAAINGDNQKRDGYAMKYGHLPKCIHKARTFHLRGQQEEIAA